MAKRFLSTRRKLLKGAAATIAAAAAPFTIGSRGLAQAGLQPVNMQLGWITGGNQIGEVVAKRLGYFEQEKINFAIQAGGPNIDGVAIVASGRYEVGQVSSSPSLMLAASQGIPVTCFAVGAQQHPYAFFSLPRAPIRTPKDMIGRKIGVQATGQILLAALLRKNGIPDDQVQKVIIGSDMTPLMTGQVDAVTGWITNTTALKVLGHDYIALRLWDCGVRLYALPYYATTDTLTQKADLSPASSGGGPRLGLRQGQSREGGRSAGAGISQSGARRRTRRRADHVRRRIHRPHQGPWLGQLRFRGLAGADRSI